jgi:hypothetical protein
MEEVPTRWRIKNGRHEGKIVDQVELDRLLALKTGVFLRYERCRIHRCGACGKLDAWTDSWGWYGSIEQIDNWEGTEPVVPKWCTEDCRKALVEAGKVPRNARRLEGG